jgi:DNA polymerase-4
MHIDINSAFATIEQQADPFLRGIPIAVVAYDSPGGVILAPSIEAKKYGIKTGMRLADGRVLCPELLAILPDPDKYRFIHRKMHKLLSKYSPEVYPKSIDEFVSDFATLRNLELTEVAKKIKTQIRKEIGERISVSIGVGTNRQLAKVAAGIVKPDGLVEINKDNFYEIYKNLKLTDLNGINTRNEYRLNSARIYNVIEFYEAPLSSLQRVFRSVNANYWYARLRGWEVDSVEFERKSFGNSYAIPQNLTSPQELSPILAKLVNKTASRLRAHSYAAYGVHIGVSFKGKGYWHHGERLAQPVFYTSDIFKAAYRILASARFPRPVHTLSITCYSIVANAPLQLSVFEDREKKSSLAKAIDKVNNRYGAFVLGTANALPAGSAASDRIAFGLPME